MGCVASSPAKDLPAPFTGADTGQKVLIAVDGADSALIPSDALKTKAKAARISKSDLEKQRMHLPKEYAFSSSGDFAKTRYAELWIKHAESIHGELADVAKIVDSDNQSAFAWTCFVRARWAAAGDDDVLLSQAYSYPSKAGAHGHFPDIVGDPSLIASVHFELHPTFSPPTLTIAHAPFEVQRVGWGVFNIGLDIVLAGSGQGIKVQHMLSFSKAHPKISSVYKIPQPGGKTMLIEVGNSHLLVDDTKEGPLASIAEGRKKRREQLNKAKARAEQVIAAQSTIDSFITSRPPEHQKMALGSVLACLFSGRDTSAEVFADFLDFAMSTLRGVELSEDNLVKVTEIMINKRISEAYTCSRPVETLDRFISHSWFDSPVEKLQSLSRWAAKFRADHGRSPIVWLDLFCLEQTHEALSKSVACLPVYLLACKQVLLLRSPSLCSRLWCLTEVYTCYVSQPHTATDKLSGIELMDMSPVSELPSRVSVYKAKCSVAEDQETLLANLDRAPGGVDTVETVVNRALGLFELKMAMRVASEAVPSSS